MLGGWREGLGVAELDRGEGEDEEDFPRMEIPVAHELPTPQQDFEYLSGLELAACRDEVYAAMQADRLRFVQLVATIRSEQVRALHDHQE